MKHWENTNTYGKLLIECRASTSEKAFVILSYVVVILFWIILFSDIPVCLLLPALFTLLSIRLIPIGIARFASDIYAYEQGILFRYNDETAFYNWDDIQGVMQSSLQAWIKVKHFDHSHSYPMRWMLHKGLRIPRWRKNYRRLMQVLEAHLGKRFFQTL